jgi:hypothetical protein
MTLTLVYEIRVSHIVHEICFKQSEVESDLSLTSESSDKNITSQEDVHKPYAAVYIFSI